MVMFGTDVSTLKMPPELASRMLSQNREAMQNHPKTLDVSVSQSNNVKQQPAADLRKHYLKICKHTFLKRPSYNYVN